MNREVLLVQRLTFDVTVKIALPLLHRQRASMASYHSAVARRTGQCRKYDTHQHKFYTSYLTFDECCEANNYASCSQNNLNPLWAYKQLVSASHTMKCLEKDIVGPLPREKKPSLLCYNKFLHQINRPIPISKTVAMHAVDYQLFSYSIPT